MTRTISLPEGLIRTNAEQRGAAGIRWVESLPGIVGECERRWSLSVGPPFPQLSYNFAAPATRVDGGAVVLKICFPDKEYMTEAAELGIYAGRGAVQLLDADLSHGVLLLEYVKPGTMLSAVKDDAEVMSIGAAVMKRLRRPAPADHDLPTVADWAKGLARLRISFEGGTGPFPARLVEQAESLSSDLLASMGEPIVLHGDLHHFNILAAEREPWLAIDPKGVVGEAEYETGALLRNPMPDIYSWPNLEQTLSRRIDQLSEELAFDPTRIRAWAAAQSLLSAWWLFEDSNGQGKELQSSIHLAETMGRLAARGQT